jgi:DnaA family protein
VQSYSPLVLDGLDNINLVCIDDIELIAGRADWEEALFDLFNRLKLSKGRLVISSNQSPQQSSIQLNDLQSRLSSGLPLNIKPLSDECTIQALIARTHHLGLELNKDTANYLISRFPRDFQTLCGLLDTLDKASLTAQRKLTIPFIKSTLEAKK